MANDEFLEAFERLLYWVTSGLRRIMEIERKPPNYAAALLIVIGCEALSRLLGRPSPYSIFVDDLMGRYPQLDRHMARGSRASCQERTGPHVRHEVHSGRAGRAPDRDHRELEGA